MRSVGASVGGRLDRALRSVIGRIAGTARPIALPRAMVALLLSSCRIFGSLSASIDKISVTLQNAIDSVNRDSEAWGSVVLNLPDKLNALESQVSAGARGLLADTVNEVNLQKQAFDTAASVAKDTIAFSLIQAQCSVAYFQSSVVSDLQYLKAKADSARRAHAVSAGGE